SIVLAYSMASRGRKPPSGNRGLSSAARRARLVSARPMDYPPGMTPRNLAELHRLQAERLASRPALRFKQHGLYHDYFWHQYRRDAVACTAALIDNGIQPGDRVGLFAENRRDWLVADIGILTAGAVCVTPHAPLTPRQVQ